ncbi:uncharacterized protein MEPE_02263 [Melanopsichium pennsylvanicum]|uniref:Effector family protein Eff1 n=1 Tax=Melanopsichium pennsylvanicum TaxID=63383 RepID=A0AAJ4XKC5_9BASI|nr:uncharacterized protein MEPE_02263 [Melanopsichium pennsylvanicum]
MNTLPFAFRGLVAAIWLLFYLNTPLAANPTRLDVYDWPEEAMQLLESGQLQSLPQRFPRWTEKQADKFLANAMLSFVEDAKAALEGSRRPNLPLKLKTASARIRHRISTVGIEQETPLEVGNPGWFSLPLHDRNPQNPKDIRPLIFKIDDDHMVPSLDLIRFDSFNSRERRGFWLPTAIIRPTYDIARQRLIFHVVYEYPTSVIRYREQYRNSPELARETLKATLDKKKDLWLHKLEHRDRNLIYDTWSNAPGSDLFTSSKFFGTEQGVVGSSRPHGPTNQGAFEVSSDEEYIPTQDPTAAASTRTQTLAYDGGQASSSRSRAPHHEPPALFEYDVPNLYNRFTYQPSRARPPYMWPQGPNRFFHHPASAFQTPETQRSNRHPDVDLDLSLAPPQPWTDGPSLS